jgi:hypothetical protein
MQSHETKHSKCIMSSEMTEYYFMKFLWHNSHSSFHQWSLSPFLSFVMQSHETWKCRQKWRNTITSNFYDIIVIPVSISDPPWPGKP